MKTTLHCVLTAAVLTIVIGASARADPAALAAKADVDRAIITVNDLQTFFAAMKQRQDAALAAYNASIAAQPAPNATPSAFIPAQ